MTVQSGHGRIVTDAIRFTADDPRIEMVPESGCWVWTGMAYPSGYGKAACRLRNGRWGRRGAHRLVWERLRGPIPDGMFLDHLCRVRSCVNPDHLRVVTPAQNNTENSLSPSAINAAKAHCPKCGGSYVRRRLGQRIKRTCVPCVRARDAVVHRIRRASVRSFVRPEDVTKLVAFAKEGK